MGLLVRGEFTLFDFLFYTDFCVSVYSYVQTHVYMCMCIYRYTHTYTT